MPLYEYQCERCGERFEKIQKFSDPPVDTCPKCGGGPVHKLIAAPAFQFKGTGWYITDYARKNAGGGKADGGSKESAAGTDSSAADSATKDDGKKEGAAGEKSDKPTKDTAKSDSAPASGSGSNSPKNA